jgi:hypothetical protein
MLGPVWSAFGSIDKGAPFSVTLLLIFYFFNFESNCMGKPQ